MTLLMTTTEAAQELRVSRDTIVRLIHAGQLPYVNVATGTRRARIRLLASDVEAWARQHRQTAHGTSSEVDPR
jgi:excisionase family DNA binding protein